MNSMEESSIHLSKPTSTQSLQSLTTSMASARSGAQRWPYDEDVVSRHSHADQEQMLLDDIMAFENRLNELGTESRPRDLNWLPFFGTILGCTAISACHWMPGVRYSRSAVLRSLSSSGAFSLSLAALVLTVALGIRHIYDRKRSGAVDFSCETLTLFQLERDKGGELVEITQNAT